MLATNVGRRRKPVVYIRRFGEIHEGKECSKCHKAKTYEEFDRLWRSKDGRQPLCKKCKRTVNAKRCRTK